MTKPVITFQYLFDPFCGWCYASAPALAALAVLAETWGEQLHMMPSGLFTNDGACAVAAIADHAWRNDQRIEQLTGQVFSEVYERDVLGNPQGVFDSGYVTRALIALGRIDPALESRFLHAVQVARYVAGRDTALPHEVAAVAVRVAAEAGISLDEAGFGRFLVSDVGLETETHKRISASARLMQHLSVSGVPLLVMTVDGVDHVIHGAPLYDGAPALYAAIDTVLASRQRSIKSG
jgi:putative protein-disulfide isomerase